MVELSRSSDSRLLHSRAKPPTTLTLLVSIWIALASSIACFAEPADHPGPVYGKGIEVLGVRLGIDSLTDVVNRLGPAEIRKVGDAATARSVVCYVATLPTEEAMISFASDSELHGAPDFTVTNIEITPADPGGTGGCKKIGETKYGSHYFLSLIGRSRESVLHDLKISLENADTTVKLSRCEEIPLLKSSEKYGYWSARRDDCFQGKPPYFNACSGLTLVFSGDRLERIMLWYVESIC